MNRLSEQNYPNLLIVAGTGRNSGKTSLVCRICEEWSYSAPLVCIKISNHFHKLSSSHVLYKSGQFSIYEETEAISDKDTERYLKAGASKVFFIEADRELVYIAFQKIREYLPLNAAIICESGTLRRFIKPSVFVMIHTIGAKPKESAKDLLALADKVYNFEAGALKFPEIPIIFDDSTWKLNVYASN